MYRIGSDAVRIFYEGCSGCIFIGEECPLIRPEMVTGVHCCCSGDWIASDRQKLIEGYRRDLDYATRMGAEYVVFHVVQVDDEEGITYKLKHTDREVIEEAADFINELLDGQKYDFWFLMENLWWPGLTFLHPEDTQILLDRVHYEKKGFMLDTGHFLHTNLDLETQEEGVTYIQKMLDAHRNMISYIKGIHLQQSLTGAYVKKWLQPLMNFPKIPWNGSAKCMSTSSRSTGMSPLQLKVWKIW